MIAAATPDTLDPIYAGVMLLVLIAYTFRALYVHGKPKDRFAADHPKRERVGITHEQAWREFWQETREKRERAERRFKGA